MQTPIARELARSIQVIQDTTMNNTGLESSLDGAHYFAGIIKMMLAIAGIEPNPGPKNKGGVYNNSNKTKINKKGGKKNAPERAAGARSGQTSNNNSHEAPQLPVDLRPRVAYRRNAVKEEMNDTELRNLVSKAARNHRPMHRYHAVPLSSYAQMQIANMSDQEETVYLALCAKYRAQVSAAQRIRSRLRKLHKDLVAERAPKGEISRVLAASKDFSVNLSDDVREFLQKGRLVIKETHSSELDSRLKEFISHGLLVMSGIAALVEFAPGHLGLEPIRGERDNTDHSAKGVAFRALSPAKQGELMRQQSINYEAYLKKHAHKWFPAYAIGEVAPHFAKVINYKKGMDRENVIFVLGKSQIFARSTRRFGKDEDSEPCGPFFMGTRMFANYISKESNYVYVNEGIITVRDWKTSDNATFSLVKRMLLVMAGIERNPGPTEDALLAAFPAFQSVQVRHLLEHFTPDEYFTINNNTIEFHLFGHGSPVVYSTKRPSSETYSEVVIIFSNFTQDATDGEELRALPDKNKNKMTTGRTVKADVDYCFKDCVNYEIEAAGGLVMNGLAQAYNSLISPIVSMAGALVRDNTHIIDNFTMKGLSLDAVVSPLRGNNVAPKDQADLVFTNLKRTNVPAAVIKNGMIARVVTAISIAMTLGNVHATFEQRTCGGIVSPSTILKRMSLMILSPCVYFVSAKNPISQLDNYIPVGPTSSMISFAPGLISMITPGRFSAASIALGLSFLLGQVKSREPNASSLVTPKESSKITFHLWIPITLFVSSLTLSKCSGLISSSKIFVAKPIQENGSSRKILTQGLLSSLNPTVNPNTLEQLTRTIIKTKQCLDHSSLSLTHEFSRSLTIKAIFLLRKFLCATEQSILPSASDTDQFSQQISLLSKYITEESSPKLDFFSYITYFEKLLQENSLILCEKCSSATTHATFPILQFMCLKRSCPEQFTPVPLMELSTCSSCLSSPSNPDTLKLRFVSCPGISAISTDALKEMMELLKVMRMLTSHVNSVYGLNSSNTLILARLLFAELSRALTAEQFSPILSRLWQTFSSSIIVKPQQKTKALASSAPKPSATTISTRIAQLLDPLPTTPCVDWEQEQLTPPWRRTLTTVMSFMKRFEPNDSTMCPQSHQEETMTLLNDSTTSQSNGKDTSSENSTCGALAKPTASDVQASLDHLSTSAVIISQKIFSGPYPHVAGPDNTPWLRTQAKKWICLISATALASSLLKRREGLQCGVASIVYDPILMSTTKVFIGTWITVTLGLYTLQSAWTINTTWSKFVGRISEAPTSLSNNLISTIKDFQFYVAGLLHNGLPVGVLF